MEVTEFGIVDKVLLRVNTNTKTPTCQERQGQKKRMHLTAFQYLLDHLEKELRERAMDQDAKEKQKSDSSYAWLEQGQCGLVSNIMRKCRRIYDSHKAMNDEVYFDDAVYRSVVSESLDVIAMGKNMFLLWLHGGMNAYFVTGHPLLECHRLRIMEQKKQLNSCVAENHEKYALDLCRNLGLVRTNVHERNVFGETPLLCAAANGAR
jgi:hypothetical protein